ncbi:class I SAM-dependent methyltransferase [Streptomyces sp. BE133]|nr:class I SAM-dependent methyltransferase [Streptomyces sp. BE133]
MLDLGCGSGVPVARALATTGHRVTGVDISEVQIRRAQELLPQAEFIRANATAVDFGQVSFEAVVSFYALIHNPLEEQLAFPLDAKAQEVETVAHVHDPCLRLRQTQAKGFAHVGDFFAQCRGVGPGAVHQDDGVVRVTDDPPVGRPLRRR